MSPSLYVSTGCLHGNQPIEDRLSTFRQYGLNAIELGAGVTTNGSLSHLILNQRNRYLIHNYFPPPSNPFVLNLASPDEQILKASIDLVTNALFLSKRINAPFYSVHAGFVTDPIGFGPGYLICPDRVPSSNEAGSAFHRFVRALEPLLDLAKDLGIRILVENNVCTNANRGKLLLQTANEFLALFGELRSPALGMLLDTGHLKVSAKTLSFDCFEFIDQLAPYVGALHVHDNDGLVDSHHFIEPGSWVLEAAKRSDFYDLPIVVEARFESCCEMVEHITWLRRELG